MEGLGLRAKGCSRHLVRAFLARCPHKPKAAPWESSGNLHLMEVPSLVFLVSRALGSLMQVFLVSRALGSLMQVFLVYPTVEA